MVAPGEAPPAAVVLQGAGVADANGLYTPSGKVAYGAPVYENDQRCLISREPHNDSRTGRSAFGWVIGQDRKPLYGAPCKDLSPPADGWTKFGGAFPLPRVRGAALLEEAATEAARAFKERGNALFKERRYIEADENWGRGLDLSDRVVDQELLVALHSNRAEVALRMQKWERALSDAEGALQLRPDHDKALLRATVAAREMKMYQEAWEFVNRCLDAHPRNNDAKHLKQELEELIERELKRLDSQAAQRRPTLAEIVEREASEGRYPKAFDAKDVNSKLGFRAFAGYGAKRDNTVLKPPLSHMPYHRMNLPPEQVELNDRYFQELRNMQDERKRLDKEAKELYPKIKSEYYLRTQEDMAMGKVLPIEEVFPSSHKEKLRHIADADARVAKPPQAFMPPARAPVGAQAPAALARPRLSAEEADEIDTLFVGLEAKAPAEEPTPEPDSRRERLRTARALLKAGAGATPPGAGEAAQRRQAAAAAVLGGTPQDLGAKLRALIAGVAAEDLDAEGRRLAEALQRGGEAQLQEFAHLVL